MREPSVFDILAEPRGAAYRALIRWCASRSSTALLVVRDGDALRATAANMLNRLAPALRNAETTQEWPGTVLLSPNDFAAVYRYNLNPPMLDVLTSAVDGLYEWTEPRQPEDLCFLREDGTAILTTIAHERDAYLSLTPDEARALRQAVPELKLSAQPRRRK